VDEQGTPTRGWEGSPVGLCRARLIMMLLLRRGHTPLETCCAHSTWFGWLGALSIRMLLRQDGRRELERRAERRFSARLPMQKKKEKKVTVQIYLTPGWMRSDISRVLLVCSPKLRSHGVWLVQVFGWLGHSTCSLKARFDSPRARQNFFPFWGERRRPAGDFGSSCQGPAGGFAFGISPGRSLICQTGAGR
jgi:hypothetical protein